MRTVIVPLSGCRSYLNLHQILQRTLGFPEYYGNNCDALWDCLTGYIERPLTVIIHGISALPADLNSEMQSILQVFYKAEHDGWGVDVVVT